MNENLITLKGGTYYITEFETDAFRVKCGTLLIYIVPFDNKVIGRRSFIYEASENEVIPSFFYRDIENHQWCFCFVALEEATIELIKNGSTKILRERFCNKANVNNYDIEGFGGSLVDLYRKNIVTEDGFIRRSQHERAEVSSRVYGIILDAFSKKEKNIEINKSGNVLYDSVAFLCQKQHIQIASFVKVKEACGDTFSIEDIARVSHFSYRKIILSQGWQNRDNGALLVFNEKDEPMVCLPKGNSAYILYNLESSDILPVSENVTHSLSANAYMIYRAFPAQKLSLKHLVNFSIKSIKKIDVLMMLALSVITSIVGIITPTISEKLYDEYIPLGAYTILFQMGSLMASFMIANLLISIVKNLFSFRVSSRIAYDFQGAVYDRLFNLPESFFRKYESADLAQRVMRAGSIAYTASNVTLTSAVSIVFLIVYFVRMLSFSKKLTIIALLMVFVYSVCCYFINLRALKHRQSILELEGFANSKMFQFLNGIDKIRIAGVEDMALFEYMKPYVKLRNSEEKQTNIINIGSTLSLVANSIFSIVFYILVIRNQENIGLGTFIAFNSMFGAFSAYVFQLTDDLLQIKSQRPSMKRLAPIFTECPEFDDAKELPGDISGNIEINNVTFAYSENSPNVLENINLNIKPGEYVGIVGSSGCGKSTLLKLLLGFEKTSYGKIYYDNKDIESVDKRELRKKMGVVLQDGKLISGSIYENITITAPKATLSDVQKTIKAVGLEKDIAEMPMGLHTMLSEDCGTISGGQQQRILIARAIISNPKILFFDEATSALDNITQSAVCDTIEKMDATRIVIAHRLSTIINCDRIIVMDKGRIVEEGNYRELMEQNGMFYQLAKRQLS